MVIFHVTIENMKNIISIIKRNIHLTAFLAIFFLFAGCDSGRFEAEEVEILPEDSYTTTDKAYLVLNVRSTDGLKSLSDFEKIKSLRLILINEEGEIEENKLTEFDQMQTEEEFSISTYAGNKKIFLIANEKAVSEFYSEIEDFEIPEEYEFTDFLNSLSEQDEAEKILNSLVIKSDYEDSDKGIPQSSSYDVSISSGETKELTLYVVRTAIKVSFTFINHRSEEVQLNSVRLSSLADRVYLFGHVGEKDITKNGTYWVDWLQSVSSESQKHPEFDNNVNFNKEKDWISDYSVPVETHHSTIPFVETESPWKIDPQETVENQNPIPGLLKKGPFYFHESKNLSENSLSTQQYYITLNIEDGDNSFSISRQLPNAKALFRNSHLDIEVNLYKGATDIYAEIKAWKQEDEVFGIVEEEN